jgi:hypothetical protein
MEKTLQQQYNLIKEGKGNKDDFLKNARRIFPEFISSLTDYNTAIHILKGKSVLSEGISNTTGKKDWFKIFNENISEAVGVKDTKEYGDQNTFEKIDKEVSKTLSNQFDNKNTKNIDNVYGQSFLMGYYTEMKDPKNANKTVDQLKAIVLKNMSKDINYYHTKTSFGVKGIGYTKDSVGMGEPKPPKGKYKSSGYGNLKENQSTHSVDPMIKPEGFQVGDKVKYKGMNHEITRIIDDRIYIKNLKYGGRPDTWVKAIDLKKSIKENPETDFKIHQSELNMLNKIKPTGEKQLKRKKELEDKIEAFYQDKLGQLRTKDLREEKMSSGTGLIVVGRTRLDNDLIDQVLEEEGYYGIWNPREGYWFFPEGEDTMDRLENELEDIFIRKGINARFEGQFN